MDGKAEGMKETDARIRLGKHSAGGFHRRAAHGRRKLIRNPVADREVPLRPRDNNGRRVMRFMAMTGAAELAMALAACSGGTGTTNDAVMNDTAFGNALGLDTMVDGNMTAAGGAAIAALTTAAGKDAGSADRKSTRLNSSH